QYALARLMQYADRSARGRRRAGEPCSVLLAVVWSAVVVGLSHRGEAVLPAFLAGARRVIARRLDRRRDGLRPWTHSPRPGMGGNQHAHDVLQSGDLPLQEFRVGHNGSFHGFSWSVLVRTHHPAS